MIDLEDYKRLYEEAAKLSTCEFIDVVCMNGECCCTQCGYLKEDGDCSIMSLLCKIWICDTKHDSLDKVNIDRLQALWYEAHKKGYLVFRGTPFTATTEETMISSPSMRLDKVHVGSGAGPKEQRCFQKRRRK